MHPIMEQNFILQRQEPQCALSGWTQQHSSAAPSLSASSIVISPGSSNNRSTSSESSGQSSSSLKEHDYIGLAEVSSASSLNQADKEIELNLAETDLRLGLGPATEAPVTCLDRTSEYKKNDVIPGKTPSLTSSQRPEGALHIQDDTHMPPTLSSTWQCLPLNSLPDVIPNPPINGFQGPAIAAASKNGGKRMYSEVMVDPRATIHLNSASGMINSGAGELRPSANAVMSIKQLQVSETKSHTVHSQGLYWSASHVPSWQPQADHRAGSHRPVASQKGMMFASGEKDGDAVRNSKLDLTIRSDSSRLQPIANEDNGPDEAPPAKGQVVGWPPVRSYRRSALATHSKPAGDEGESQSTIYVKVNMDGIPIGRKVDLNAYKSYDGLLSALEDMFHNPNSGHATRFLKGSEFVLTYEDKEGDWMLVGDVPWGMFVNTVRRLRITRGSDMTGLGSSTSTCHA